MRRISVVLLVMGLLATFSLPVMAQEQNPQDCNVSFDVRALKNKLITINKEVNKVFNFNVDLNVTIEGLPAWAEVEVFKCDHNIGNALFVQGIIPKNNILNSFNGFTGIAQVNQGAGYLNNQGNVAALGITGTTGVGLSMVEAAVEKTNIGNALVVVGCNFSDTITSSFLNFTGVAQVNQGSGCLNNQNNVLALGANNGGVGLVAENDTFLSMQNSGNAASITNTPSTATIGNSFNGGRGIAQVNQAPGSLSNQANIVSISSES